MNPVFVLVCAAFAATAAPASAIDVWDLTGNDDDGTTESELVHGSSEVHDLEAAGGVADQDWFRFSMKRYSSYEAVIDGASAGLAVIPVVAPGDELALDLLLEPSQSGLWKSARGVGSAGAVRSLTMIDLLGGGHEEAWIRVSSPQCDTACGSNEQYRIRLRETTLGLARFNNSGGQVTLLVLQNAADRVLISKAFLFDLNGTLLGEAFFQLQPHGVLVWDTREMAGTYGTGMRGSIRVTHDGRYGDVSGKGVALEPATGFTFDTQLIPQTP